MNVNINPRDCQDKLFKIKKLQYNTYEVDHVEIKGTLRLLNIPTNIMEVPEKLVPAEQKQLDVPTFIVGSQTIVAFTSRGKKKEPSLKMPSGNDMKTAKRVDLTSYILDQPYEPWSEIIVQGDPPILLKQRTILAKLEWFSEYTNQLGDPYLWANHTTTQSVSIAKTGEGGMV